ncbi:MAG TPA: hypothetical protein VK904_07080 [Miltoncostaeaceae bacterium]|nr:hypothetical protein [Miltoncostaeaceae bacterium]
MRGSTSATAAMAAMAAPYQTNVRLTSTVRFVTLVTVRRRSYILIGVAVLVVALVVGGVLIWRTLDDTEPVTASDALTEYRESPTPGEAAPGLPGPGVYEYAVTGSEQLSRGPVDIDRALPAVAPMLVRHQDGGYDTDVRYSDGHTELSRYELRPQGAFVTFARTVVKTPVSTTTRDREWTPNLLRLPIAPKVGETWGGPFTAGDLELQIENEVLRRETVDVGGRPVSAFVIESRQDITGEYTGSRTETFWYAPARGLVVRYAIDSTLDGPTDFDIRAEQTLRSLSPRT